MRTPVTLHEDVYKRLKAMIIRREVELEAFHIRLALEGEAASLFVMRASKEAKDQLVRLGQRFDQVAVTDPVACDETDVAIHLHIAWSTGFERLAQLIETSKVETATILGNFWDGNLPDYRPKVGIHGPLIEALLGSDAEQAMRMMWQHIDQFGQVTNKSASNGS